MIAEFLVNHAAFFIARFNLNFRPYYTCTVF
jgi:hypothetical protein